MSNNSKNNDKKVLIALKKIAFKTTQDLFKGKITIGRNNAIMSAVRAQLSAIKLTGKLEENTTLSTQLKKLLKDDEQG